MSKLLAILLALLVSGQACAWGAAGHRVTGALAYDLLAPGAKRAVDHLLQGQSLEDAATWADDMRSNRDNADFWGYDHAATWHFINVAPGESYAQSTKSPAGDAYQALAAFRAILELKPVPPGPVRDGLVLYFGNLDDPRNSAALQVFALRFLVHLVGDLHQPLHVAYAHDRGGNDFSLAWENRPANLHGLWDTRLVNALAGNDGALQRQLQRRLDTLSARDRDALAAAPPIQWLAETAELRDRVYRETRTGGNYGADYAEHFREAVELQLLAAALRLAGILNGLYADDAN